MGKLDKTDIPRKEIRKLLKRITPELEALLSLIDETDEDVTESVTEELIRNGARNLLIARRIIREHKNGFDSE